MEAVLKLVIAFLLLVLVTMFVNAARAESPGFLQKSLDKTIIYGPHGTSRTQREAPGTGTSYVYPDAYEDDENDQEEYESDDNESDYDGDDY